MRRLVLLLAAVVLASSPGLLAASPAQAAAPTCTSWSTFIVPASTGEAVHVPSAGYQTGVLDCVLKQGNRNNAVKVLQRALRYCMGKDYIAIDGDYGPLTKTAILAIQGWVNQNWHVGLALDGEYGPQTRHWINYVTFFWPENRQSPWCEEAPY